MKEATTKCDSYFSYRHSAQAMRFNEPVRNEEVFISFHTHENNFVSLSLTYWGLLNFFYICIHCCRMFAFYLIFSTHTKITYVDTTTKALEFHRV